MKLFYFHPEALAEADEAAKFYEDRQKGLAKRFVEELTDAINKIRNDPELYKIVDDNIRKCRLSHFPYGIIYRDKGEVVEIIAVMHLRRKPGYWKSRV